MKNSDRFIKKIETALLSSVSFLLLLAVFVPWGAYAEEHVSLGAKADALQYRCEIVTIYGQLHSISQRYGDILINEDENVIFYASTEAVKAFQQVRGELDDIYVPEQMKEPHVILTKSVDTYIQSARNIEKALGIYLGEYEGEEEETIELINSSEEMVVLGNKYLSESLDMHDKLLAFDEDASKNCKKYVAGL